VERTDLRVVWKGDAAAAKQLARLGDLEVAEAVSDDAGECDQYRVMRTKHSCPNDLLTVDVDE
jgi:hypothetical protein